MPGTNGAGKQHDVVLREQPAAEGLLLLRWACRESARVDCGLHSTNGLLRNLHAGEPVRQGVEHRKTHVHSDLQDGSAGVDGTHRCPLAVQAPGAHGIAAPIRAPTPSGVHASSTNPLLNPVERFFDELRTYGGCQPVTTNLWLQRSEPGLPGSSWLQLFCRLAQSVRHKTEVQNPVAGIRTPNAPATAPNA